jgi:hypothetical protein
LIVADWLQTIFQFLPVARYNSSLPTLSNGSTGEAQLDQRGRLIVRVDSSVDPGQQFARTRYVGPVAGSIGAQAVTGACKLLHVLVQNRAATDRHLHLFDTTTAPTTGVSVPKLSYRIPANALITLDFSLKPHDFAVGVLWAVSSGASPYVSTADTFYVEIVTEALS